MENSNKRSALQVMGLPNEVGAFLLTFTLILMLSPYVAGADFGIVKIPIFAPSIQSLLKIFGPIFFLVSVLLFPPLWKRRAEPPPGKPSVSLDIKSSNLEKIELSEASFDIRQLRSEGAKQATFNGSIEPVSFRGSKYIVKRTQKEMVDVKSLSELVGQPLYDRYDSAKISLHKSVTIATPIKVWEEGNDICELHPYYEGIILSSVIERNNYKLQGIYLGIIYNCGMKALRKLHSLGLLHRDLIPDNMLMTPSGDIVILDVSSCSRQGRQDKKAWNPSWSPPEQEALRAVQQSDWYTMASTVYFLANGEAPPSNIDRLREGILNINLGPFSRKNREDTFLMFDSLLSREVEKRPSSYGEIGVKTATLVAHRDLHSVIDLNNLGFLILYPGNMSIVPSREQAIRELQQFEKSGDIEDKLRADIKNFVAGGNPWVTGYVK